ncbi:protein LacX, plasmid [Microbulbifer aestuariivivens]|uniref:Protein LacX, plasmid n=1 Tax=Microbulbifer aestuariivivens TaxID=1908308 RepID=A0ABP9WST1_9GAMM
MPTISIANPHLSARIRLRGAELCSLNDTVRQRELLWRGDPAVWSGTAPILFPAVGRLRESGFRYRGQFYDLPIHGFAAARDFSIESRSPSAVTLRLSDTAATRAVYPFAFDLRVRFELIENTIRIDYAVTNPAAEPLIFSLGSHPAFALPAASMGEAAAQLHFDREEEGVCHRIRDGLLGDAEPLCLAERRLMLRADTFAEDAIILRNLRSRRLSLYAAGERLLTFDTGGAPHLGLWAKPNAPYLCVEPWLTTDDSRDAPLEISAKPGFITLSERDCFQMHYQVCV